MVRILYCSPGESIVLRVNCCLLSPFAATQHGLRASSPSPWHEFAAICARSDPRARVREGEVKHRPAESLRQPFFACVLAQCSLRTGEEERASESELCFARIIGDRGCFGG
jgi:hypothetical protein